MSHNHMDLKAQNKIPEKKNTQKDRNATIEEKNVRSVLWFSMNHNIMGI